MAQLTSGAIQGTLRDPDGRPVAGAPVLITGGAGFRTVVHSNSNGEFVMTLPYGRYRLSVGIQFGGQSSGATIFVAPLETERLDLVIDASGAIRGVRPAQAGTPGMWTDATRTLLYPEAFSLPGLLLSREPSSVTEPLDFAGLSDNRLAVESQRGFSWTDTQYKLQGMDATDSYQPGLPAVLPDVQALDEVLVCGVFAQTASSSAGTEVGLFLASPGASWHGELSTAYAGAALSSTNLPPPASRGLVQQADQFRWFTRNRLEIGGPLTRWADIYASGSRAMGFANRAARHPRDRSAQPAAVWECPGPRPGRRSRSVRCAVQRLADRSLRRRHACGPRSTEREPHGAVFRPAGRIPR